MEFHDTEKIIASIGSKFSFKEQTGGSVGFDVQFLKYFQVQPIASLQAFPMTQVYFFLNQAPEEAVDTS